MAERKFEKKDLSNCVKEQDVFRGMSLSEAWDYAINHVTMGVAVIPAKVDDEYVGGYKNADYSTETGRTGQFYFVMIDRENTGEWQALSPCSDYYTAIKPHHIYNELRGVIEHTGAKPIRVYNSYNGGSQELVLNASDMVGVDDSEGVTMEIVMRTSLDRSSYHTMTIRPRLDSGVPLYFEDTGKNGFNFKIRHTERAKTEIVNFNLTAASITKGWNDTIMPYVRFLSDGQLTEEETKALLDNIMDDANLSEKARKEIETAYKAGTVDAGSNSSHAMKAVASVCEWNEKMESPVTKQRNAEKIGKAINRRVSQAYKKKSEQ